MPNPFGFYFDGDLRRIYEVPVDSSYTLDGLGYRIYVPDDIPSASAQVNVSYIYLWSRYVDFHFSNQWATLALSKVGGAFRYTDAEGNSVYQTFDLRLLNDWEIVPADYPHGFTINGNLFPNALTGKDFDTDRITSPGVSPRIFFSDSLQTVGGIWTVEEKDQVLADAELARDHARLADVQTQP